jgi:cellulose biosynthesis protein BcsQ
LNLYAKTKAVEDQKCFRRLLKEGAALGYRYAVFDTSPGFSSLERAVFMAADELVVPLEADSFALDGLQIFSEHLKQFREYEERDSPYFNKIVVNKIDKRIAQHEEIIQQIRRYRGTFSVYEIPVDQAFKKCQRARMTIQEWTGTKPDTLAAVRKLAADLAEEV